MVERQADSMHIEEAKSAVATRGFVELPHNAELDDLIGDLLKNPDYASRYGSKRVFELVDDDFPMQEVVLVYDQTKMEAVEFPTESVELEVGDEETRDLNARTAATLSMLGYPVIFIESVTQSGKVEKKTFFLNPLEDLELQTA